MYVDELRSKEFKVFIPQVEINICAHEMKLFPCDYGGFFLAITIIQYSGLHLYPESDKWKKVNTWLDVHSITLSYKHKIMPVSLDKIRNLKTHENFNQTNLMYPYL